MIQIASDNFQRANGGLGSNWTTTFGTFAITSHLVAMSVQNADLYGVSQWNANNFPDDQYSEVTLATSASTLWQVGPAVRIDPSAETFYWALPYQTNTLFIQKLVGGTATNLASVAYTPANGDVVRLVVQGSTLTAYVNGTQVLTTSDSSITSGAAGIAAYQHDNGDISSWDAGGIGFAFKQAGTPVTGTNGPVSITLGAAPTQGNVVWVSVVSFDGTATPPTVTVQDQNGNNYSATPNSPSLGNSEAITAGAPWLFKLIAPANASATIKATFSGTTTFCYIAAVEFAVIGGSASFDTDAAGNGGSGTALNTPTITPAGAGELLFFLASPAHTITSVNSPWTRANTITSGIACGYILSGSAGGTAVNCTINASSAWEAMAGAFIFTASGGGGGTPNLRMLMGVGT